MQHAPESGYCDTEMKSSVYVLSIFPWLMAPTVNTTLTSSGSAVTYVFMSLISGALNEKPTRRAPAGKYFVTGPFTTLNSFSGPLDARMESFCRSCTMSPQKRLNVLGMRVCGLMRINTFFCVCTNTALTRPALFSGLSRIARSSWCTMSGR